MTGVSCSVVSVIEDPQDQVVDLALKPSERGLAFPRPLPKNAGDRIQQAASKAMGRGNNTHTRMNRPQEMD